MPREYERYQKQCKEDFEKATSEPLVITLFGPNMEEPGGELRRGLATALRQNHIVNIPEELEKPPGYHGELKAWEAVQVKNSDLLLHLPDSPGSIGEMVYLTYPTLAMKTVFFCQEEHRAGYVGLALLHEHEVKHDHVYYYSKDEADPEALLGKIEELLRYLSIEKWLRQGEMNGGTQGV